MGLLNRGGDKKKAPKQKAEGKKKKKRSSSGGAGMANAKQWLMLNVEKLVLGLIGVSALFLIYKGVSGAGLAPNQGPDQLTSKLTSADNALRDGNGDAMRAVRYPEPDTFDQQAAQDTSAVDAEQYATAQPFFRILKEQQKLRQDPDLLPAVDILVRSGYGPLMIKEEESALATFATQDENVRALTENLNTKWKGSISGEGKAKPVFFNTIVGIIPLRDQLAAYNTAFIGAAEYDLGRDFPRYVQLKIQRRETGSQEWVPLNVMENIVVGPEEWTGSLEGDIAQKYSPDYVKNLIMPIPPIAGIDINPFISHPKLQTEAEADAEAQAEEKALAEKEAAAERTAAITGSSDVRTTNAELNMTDEERAFKQLSTNADIGMFRYFDMEVEPGKSYEYRVQLVLEDPNNPIPDGGSTKPTQDALDPKVLVRLADVASSEGLSIRETEWTEPTSPVRVPRPGKAYVSTTAAGATLRGTDIPAFGDKGEPTANVVAIGFDLSFGYVAPVTMEVTRGVVLNSKQETEVIDPSKNRIVKLEDYTNKTNIMVVDIAGGKVVSTGREELRSPGKILLVGADGSFTVSDEFGDEAEYESSIIPPEEVLTPNPPQPEEREPRGGRRRDPRGDQPLGPDNLPGSNRRGGPLGGERGRGPR
ncbi:MAG: hypothetical protein KDB27_20900 [Planctomycetales bacterium]|nr:hypothetical protein [Planctomycetales bacterium]